MDAFSHQTKFSPAPASLTLDGREVHVWLVDLDAERRRVNEYSTLLSDDETQRGNRFKFPKDQEHFKAGRAILRLLLGRYLDTDPTRLTFDYNSFGKPSLPDSQNQIGLAFNLSHSGGLASYGFTLHRAIGIDIEKYRPDFGTEEIARNFFSNQEVESLSRLPADQKTIGFFNCWTRKEAYIKAHGQGLSMELSRFGFTLAPTEPARIMFSEFDPPGRSPWQVQPFYPNDQFAGAVIVGGTDEPTYHWFQWQQTGSFQS